MRVSMNGYQRYKKESIYSMNEAELLLTLYDEAISRLKRAKMALSDREYALFEENLGRVVRIVRYLMEILDLQQPLSGELRRIYTYLLYDLGRIRAGREKQEAEIGRVSHILSELREAFAEAGRRTGGGRTPQAGELRG